MKKFLCSLFFIVISVNAFAFDIDGFRLGIPDSWNMSALPSGRFIFLSEDEKCALHYQIQFYDEKITTSEKRRSLAETSRSGAISYYLYERGDQAKISNIQKVSTNNLVGYFYTLNFKFSDQIIKEMILFNKKATNKSLFLLFNTKHKSDVNYCNKFFNQIIKKTKSF